MKAHRLGVWIALATLCLAPMALAQDLSGAWPGQAKCQGLQGPAQDIPGMQEKANIDVALLIKQGNASATPQVGALSSNALDVLALTPDYGSLLGAWCGWMNTSVDDPNKGQGSLGPFAFNIPVSLSVLFREDAPPPFSTPTFLVLGDSTMHITKWETLAEPDKNGCDAKLEMSGSLWFPGGSGPPYVMSPSNAGGAWAFASCTFKLKRCPGGPPPINFCSYWGAI